MTWLVNNKNEASRLDKNPVKPHVAFNMPKNKHLLFPQFLSSLFIILKFVLPVSGLGLFLRIFEMIDNLPIEENSRNSLSRLK